MHSIKKQTPELVLFVKRKGCPYCEKMIELLQRRGLYPQLVYVEDVKDLFLKSHSTVPRLYFRGKHKGDYNTVNLQDAMHGERLFLEYILK